MGEGPRNVAAPVKGRGREGGLPELMAIESNGFIGVFAGFCDLKVRGTGSA